MRFQVRKMSKKARILAALVLCGATAVTGATLHLVSLGRDLDAQIARNAELEQKNAKLKSSVERLRACNAIPGISQQHLKRVISSTLRYLSIPKISDWSRLILLTIATESDMGRYLKQIKGPARGLVQVEPATERTALDWLKSKQPALYEKIKKLRIPARLSTHEAEYNLSYSVALCYAVYAMRHVDPTGKTSEQLAKLYKIHYNTVKGKATIDGVLIKLADFKVRI